MFEIAFGPSAGNRQKIEEKRPIEDRKSNTTTYKIHLKIREFGA